MYDQTLTVDPSEVNAVTTTHIYDPYRNPPSKHEDVPGERIGAICGQASTEKDAVIGYDSDAVVVTCGNCRRLFDKLYSGQS